MYERERTKNGQDNLEDKQNEKIQPIIQELLYHRVIIRVRSIGVSRKQINNCGMDSGMVGGGEGLGQRSLETVFFCTHLPSWRLINAAGRLEISFVHTDSVILP